MICCNKCRRCKNIVSSRAYYRAKHLVGIPTIFDIEALTFLLVWKSNPLDPASDEAVALLIYPLCPTNARPTLFVLEDTCIYPALVI